MQENGFIFPSEVGNLGYWVSLVFNLADSKVLCGQHCSFEQIFKSTTQPLASVWSGPWHCPDCLELGVCKLFSMENTAMPSASAEWLRKAQLPLCKRQWESVVKLLNPALPKCRVKLHDSGDHSRPLVMCQHADTFTCIAFSTYHSLQR